MEDEFPGENHHRRPHSQDEWTVSSALPRPECQPAQVNEKKNHRQWDQVGRFQKEAHSHRAQQSRICRPAGGAGEIGKKRNGDSRQRRQGGGPSAGGR